MPRKNITTIIEAFARGYKPSGRSDRIYGDSRQTCSTDGETIYSYNEPIAVRVHDGCGTVLVLETWSTNTTRAQINACKLLLPRYGFRVIVVPRLPRLGSDSGAIVVVPTPSMTTVESRKSRKSRKWYRYRASARPHGRCEFADHCVEHAANPSVAACKE